MAIKAAKTKGITITLAALIPAKTTTKAAKPNQEFAVIDLFILAKTKKVMKDITVTDN